MKRVESVSEFLSLVPELVHLFERLKGAWDPGSTKDEFIEKTLIAFQNGAAVFISWDNHHSDFDYVITLERRESNQAFIGLFYVGPHYRNQTKNLIQELRVFCSARGVKQVRWLSTHLTSSYRRWVAKQGAEPVAMLYQLDI